MFVAVLRYSLRHNGKIYKAGQTADLPESLARRLAARNPKNYALISTPEAVKAEIVEAESRESTAITEEEQTDLDAMTVAQLKKYAAELGIVLPSKARREQIIAVIRDKTQTAELPAVDFAGTVV